ncbi:MAG: hypothetical protein M3383_06540 [Actinomycetota bacterium]|nr:hypothetical protein [Actinomycetota bacterium]
MRRLLAIALIASGFALFACGDSEDEPDAAPAATAAASGDEVPAGGTDPGGAKAGAGTKGDSKPKPEAEGTEIVVGESQFGEMVFDGSNQAIYLFDKETSTEAECYGECAEAWPPVLTDGEPVAGDGADQKLLGTTERDDGSVQVTYAGQPLYYYAHEGPGQVLCHNVSEFGGLWLVFDGAGDALP